MCRCCEIIKYWICCCYGEEEDEYDFDTICGIDWTNYQFDNDNMYGAEEIK